jgi:hypothetical protein
VKAKSLLKRKEEIMKKLLALGAVATIGLTACTEKSAASFTDNIMGAMTEVTDASGTFNATGTVKLFINDELVNTVNGGENLAQESSEGKFYVKGSEYAEEVTESGLNMEFFDDEEVSNPDYINHDGDRTE